MTFREHDIVVLTAARPEAGLKPGDVGTVVHCYDEASAEVEFTTAAGDTIAVVTLPIAQLRAPTAMDVAAVRTA